MKRVPELPAGWAPEVMHLLLSLMMTCIVLSLIAMLRGVVQPP
jgi:hypothetical protein